MPATARKKKLQTTTVRMPRGLYEEARQVVQKGKTGAASLNELLVESLGERLRQLRRQDIDAEFAGMRDDAHYQRESESVAEQFATSDQEAFQLAEKAKP